MTGIEEAVPDRAVPGPAVPDGGVLLHIGLPKTGTTAIQHAGSELRERLAGSGVVYPGRGLNHAMVAAAFMGTPHRGENVPMHVWHRALEEMAGARVGWLSQERIADADDDMAAAMVQALGRPVHVVVTLRRIGSWLPSVWQQYVKSGYSESFEAWLPTVLADPPAQIHEPPFFYERPSVVVERWSRVADRVTVVVLDAAHPEILPRSFEQLLGLAPGALEVGELGGFRANRGLSVPEAELVRRVNLDLDRAALPRNAYFTFVRFGVVAGLQQFRVPAPGEARPGIPEALRPHVQRYVDDEIAALTGLPVGVLGDLASLGGSLPADPGPAPTRVPLALATDALLGGLSQAVGRGVAFEHDDPSPSYALAADPSLPAQRAAAALSDADLSRLLRRRALEKLRRPRRR